MNFNLYARRSYMNSFGHNVVDVFYQMNERLIACALILPNS
jgi:hypothetical protein